MLHKRSIRIVANEPYLAHTSPLFKKLKILKIHDLVELETLKFVIQFKLHKLPHIFNNYFTPIQSSSRQSHLQIPRHRTNYRERSIQIQGPKIYNKTCHNVNINVDNTKSLKKSFLSFKLNTY